MKRSFIKITTLSMVSIVLLLAFTGCCKKCCSPSIEVSLDRPSMQIWTWDPITLYPKTANQEIPYTWGVDLSINHPYQLRAKVVNESDVDVRAVTVVFSLASFGWADRGTPIGAVAVDVPAGEFEWVRSPSFSLPYPVHLCLTAKIYHPCDTDLGNNDRWLNVDFVSLYSGWQLDTIPFTADFVVHRGAMVVDVKVEPGEGVDAYVAYPRALERPVKELKIEEGAAQDLMLVVKNTGADFAPGDTFTVKAIALQDDEEVSSFEVRYLIEE